MQKLTEQGKQRTVSATQQRGSAAFRELPTGGRISRKHSAGFTGSRWREPASASGQGQQQSRRDAGSLEGIKAPHCAYVQTPCSPNRYAGRCNCCHTQAMAHLRRPQGVLDSSECLVVLLCRSQFGGSVG